MEKKIISLLISTLLICVTVASVTGTEPQQESNASIFIQTPNETDDPGDILWNWDVQAPTGDDQILGIEWDENYFYITGGGGTSGGGVNKLHFFEYDGTYITSIDQGTTSSWGWRDIAFDGTYMYASDSSQVIQFEVTGLPGSPVLNQVGSFPGPTNPNRALAYDPATDHFWTGNFGDPIYEFDRTGTIINTFPNPGWDVYGMAWDNICDGGPYLWVNEQSGSGCHMHQVDPVTGTPTGLQYDYTQGIAGGLTIIDYDGLVTMVGITQGDPDEAYAIELCPSNLAPEIPGAPDGPDNGATGVEYTFTATTTDPEGEDIYYWFEWGDGENSGWVGPYASGVTGEAKHIWTSPGIFDVTVKAKDINDRESDFSDPHPIDIVEGPIMNILPLKSGLFKVKATIRNDGAVEATDVAWTITLDGGSFINTENSGTIPSILPDESEEVSTGFILGFGPTTVTVTADVTPGVSDIRDQSGTVLLFFIKIKPGGG